MATTIKAGTCPDEERGGGKSRLSAWQFVLALRTKTVAENDLLCLLSHLIKVACCEHFVDCTKLCDGYCPIFAARLWYLCAIRFVTSGATLWWATSYTGYGVSRICEGRDPFGLPVEKMTLVASRG